MSRRSPFRHRTKSLGLDAALRLHAETRARLGYAPSTLTFERRLLRALLPRLGKPLGRVRPADVRALFAVRSGEVANDTAARELGTLRVFFALLVEEGLLPTNPAADLALTYRGVRASPPLVLTEKAVQRLLVAASEEPRCRRSPAVRRALALRNRATLELLYGLGIRSAELRAACIVDLDLKQGSMLVRRVKRGEPRRVPLPQAALPHLERYLSEGRPLLARGGRDRGRVIVTERGGPLRSLQLERIVNSVARKVGLRAHPHAFRRSLASHLVARGASLLAVQKLLGHVSLDTTQVYVLVDRAALHEAVKVLDRVRATRHDSKTRGN